MTALSCFLFLSSSLCTALLSGFKGTLSLVGQIAEQTYQITILSPVLRWGLRRDWRRQVVRKDFLEEGMLALYER